MNLPPRALLRACVTATALCGATLLFSTGGAAAAPSGDLIPGVTLPPVTIPPLPPPPTLPVPLPTTPKTTPPTTTPATPAVPVVPSVPTVPGVTVPTPPGGSTPTLPTLPGGSTPTLPPEVTIPDVPGVDLELCAKLELLEQPLLDTCLKDATATSTTVPGTSRAPAKPAKPSAAVKPAAAAAAATSAGGSGGSGGGSGGGTLARTGSDLGTPVAIGAGLAALGALALAGSRFLPRLLDRVFIQ